MALQELQSSGERESTRVRSWPLSFKLCGRDGGSQDTLGAQTEVEVLGAKGSLVESPTGAAGSGVGAGVSPGSDAGQRNGCMGRRKRSPARRVLWTKGRREALWPAICGSHFLMLFWVPPQEAAFLLVLLHPQPAKTDREVNTWYLPSSILYLFTGTVQLQGGADPAHSGCSDPYAAAGGTQLLSVSMVPGCRGDTNPGQLHGPPPCWPCAPRPSTGSRRLFLPLLAEKDNNPQGGDFTVL